MMFIYRDEYYNQETEKQGVAEISIAKHRNGPAGVHVELSFLSRFPKFANIARVEQRRGSVEQGSARQTRPSHARVSERARRATCASGAAPSAAATGSCWTTPATRSPASAARRACGACASAGGSSVIPRKYRGVSFDRAPVTNLEPTTSVRQVRRFIHNIDRRTSAAGQGLWFMGDVGHRQDDARDAGLQGRARRRALASRSTPCRICSPRSATPTTATRASAPTWTSSTASPAVDLLHLEDLGAEKQTDWVLEQLYSLVNERYEQQRSILVTTNLRVREARGADRAAHRVAHRRDVRRPAAALRRGPPHRLGPGRARAAG